MIKNKFKYAREMKMMINAAAADQVEDYSLELEFINQGENRETVLPFPLSVPRKTRTPRIIIETITHSPSSFDHQDYFNIINNEHAVIFKKRDRDNNCRREENEDADETRRIGKQSKKQEKNKKRRRNIVIRQPPAPPPEVPREFKNYIDSNILGGFVPVFVLQKELTKTDLSAHHNRLSMPSTRINGEFEDNFLTREEKAYVQSKGHIEVNLLIDGYDKGNGLRNFHEYKTLCFTMWPMTMTSIYVLTTDWNTVWTDNELEEGMLVQIWSLRVGSKLCFALAVQRN